MTLFESRMQEYKSFFEGELEKFLPEFDREEQALSDAVKYAVLDGGKRIRPILVFEFCRICCGDYKRATPFAAAIEMIHSYSLVHDDLPCMDDDDMRRGKPSCHKAFGESTALLAGDSLLTLAFETISGYTDFSAVTHKQAINALRILAENAGAQGMIGGQIIDLKNEGKQTSLDTLRRMDNKKTGALISAACLMGCEIGGAGDAQMKAAEKYAQSIGLAFQIVDDILDVEGDPAKLGKMLGSDSSNEKSTYVSLLGIEKAKSFADELTNEALNSLEIFGSEGEFLRALALFLAKRDN